MHSKIFLRSALCALILFGGNARTQEQVAKEKMTQSREVVLQPLQEMYNDVLAATSNEALRTDVAEMFTPFFAAEYSANYVDGLHAFTQQIHADSTIAPTLKAAIQELTDEVIAAVDSEKKTWWQRRTSLEKAGVIGGSLAAVALLVAAAALALKQRGGKKPPFLLLKDAPVNPETAGTDLSEFKPSDVTFNKFAGPVDPRRLAGILERSVPEIGELPFRKADALVHLVDYATEADVRALHKAAKARRLRQNLAHFERVLRGASSDFQHLDLAGSLGRSSLREAGVSGRPLEVGDVSMNVFNVRAEQARIERQRAATLALAAAREVQLRARQREAASNWQRLGDVASNRSVLDELRELKIVALAQREEKAQAAAAEAEEAAAREAEARQKALSELMTWVQTATDAELKTRRAAVEGDTDMTSIVIQEQVGRVNKKLAELKRWAEDDATIGQLVEMKKGLKPGTRVGKAHLERIIPSLQAKVLALQTEVLAQLQEAKEAKSALEKAVTAFVGSSDSEEIKELRQQVAGFREMVSRINVSKKEHIEFGDTDTWGEILSLEENLSSHQNLTLIGTDGKKVTMSFEDYIAAKQKAYEATWGASVDSVSNLLWGTPTERAAKAAEIAREKALADMRTEANAPETTAAHLRTKVNELAGDPEMLEIVKEALTVKERAEADRLEAKAADKAREESSTRIQKRTAALVALVGDVTSISDDTLKKVSPDLADISDGQLQPAEEAAARKAARTQISEAQHTYLQAKLERLKSEAEAREATIKGLVGYGWGSRTPAQERQMNEAALFAYDMHGIDHQLALLERERHDAALMNADQITHKLITYGNYKRMFFVAFAADTEARAALREAAEKCRVARIKDCIAQRRRVLNTLKKKREDLPRAKEHQTTEENKGYFSGYSEDKVKQAKQSVAFLERDIARLTDELAKHNKVLAIKDDVAYAPTIKDQVEREEADILADIHIPAEADGIYPYEDFKTRLERFERGGEF